MILCAYFVNSIVGVHLSKSTWCKQLDMPNKNVFVKVFLSKCKSVESQNIEKRGKITSLVFSIIDRTDKNEKDCLSNSKRDTKTNQK